MSDVSDQRRYYERMMDEIAVEHQRQLDQLQAENDKLREGLAKWVRLTAGIDLPEYPVTQFKPKDLERENAKLQDKNARLRSCLSDDTENARMIMGENDKLRELVKKLVILAFARCADCDLLDASCALVPTQKCLLWNECESIARELGVEVDA